MSLLDLAKHAVIQIATESYQALDAAAAGIARFEEFCNVLAAHDLNIEATAAPIKDSPGPLRVIFCIFLTSEHAYQSETLLRTLVAMGCSYKLHTRGTDNSLTYIVTADGAGDVPNFTLRIFPIRCAA